MIKEYKINKDQVDCFYNMIGEIRLAVPVYPYTIFVHQTFKSYSTTNGIMLHFEYMINFRHVEDYILVRFSKRYCQSYYHLDLESFLNEIPKEKAKIILFNIDLFSGEIKCQ